MNIMSQSLVEEKIAMVSAYNEYAEGVTLENTDTHNTLKIQSRFGPITIYKNRSIAFPHGIPGIASSINFCLTEVPNIQNNQFKLLQCLEDHALSFIVVPSTYDNQLLEQSDVDDACKILGINKNNLLLLFIVTVHNTLDGRKLSINAKAPIFIDAETKDAVQFVFQNNNYPIQHFIS